MRQLTIRREKSIICSGKKDQIYIEDPQSTDCVIDNVACRKLGELRNGEEKTFSVGEDAVRLFVVTGKVGRKTKKDSVWLPAGQEDIILSGTHLLELGGNGSFRFLRENSPEAAKKRRRSKILGLIVLVLGVTLGSLAGRYTFKLISGSGKPADKDFFSNGMTITLTQGFAEEDYLTMTAAYVSKDVLVLALREPFTLLEGAEELTLDRYGELVLKANGLSDLTLQFYNGIPGFEYDFTNGDVKKDFHYRIYLYKGGDAFWTVQFITEKKAFDELEDKINTWAASVRFGKQ